MFQKASRQKLRFISPQGLLTVEDLWDIPLTTKSVGRASLDDIARSLYRALKEASEVDSFVKKSTKDSSLLQLQFDIVKHVIDIRVTEQEAAELAKSNREKKQAILSLIKEKENEKLSSSSIEELRAMAESL